MNPSGRLGYPLRAALSLLAAAAGCAASAADPPAAAAAPVASTAASAAGDWHALNRLAGRQARARDYAGLHDTLERLAPSMPGSPTVAYNLAASAARLGRAEEALSRLARLADAGFAYDVGADDDFQSLATRSGWQALRDRFAANRAATGRPVRLGGLGGSDRLPESLAWDAGTRRLFVADVRHCEIRVWDVPDGRAPAPAGGRPFARLPSSVFALGIDTARHRLWAGIATVAQADGCGEGPPTEERTALVALDLRSGRVLQRIDPHLPGLLGDLLVAPDGTVFVTESLHGAVLRLRPGAAALERIDVAGEFESPQTPALAADGRTLYVPDYARGLALIDLGSCPCPARWPAHGAGVFTAGIDGLVRDGRSLVAVQNGTVPPRIVRFSADLSRQQVLESGTPGLGEPTHGVVVGRSLWYIADVGWDRYDASGNHKPGAAPEAAALRRIDLGPRAP